MIEQLWRPSFDGGPLRIVDNLFANEWSRRFFRLKKKKRMLLSVRGSRYSGLESIADWQESSAELGGKYSVESCSTAD
jgi:hypothetical protein